jgi:hypothetical protein
LGDRDETCGRKAKSESCMPKEKATTKGSAHS